LDPTTDIKEQPLTTKAVRSGAWLYGRNLVTSLINLGVMAILARQLTPADFGLVALAQVLLRFVVILSEGGVGEFIISDNREGRQERVQAAFWLNLVFSGAVLLLGLLVLPWITRFYQESGLAVILILLGMRYLISQVTLVPYSLIRRELSYNKLVVIDSIAEITSSLISVVMAITGWGVLSLVVPGVVLAPLRAVAFLYAAHWLPRLPLRTSELKGIFRYSANVVIGSLATAIGSEGDTLIIGKTLGSQSLGLYNIAWGSANMVHRNLISPVSGIALPAYSSMVGDLERMRSAFHRMIRLLSSISFPLLIGLFVVADLFILTIYGPQWELSILPLRILIIYALRYAIGSPANAVFYAVRRPDIQMKFSLVFVPFYLVCVFAGSAFGIVGVAIGVTVARTVFGLIQLGASSRLAGSHFSEALRQTVPALAASCLMGAVVALFRVFLAPYALPGLVELVLSVAVGGLAYLLLLIFAFHGPLEELLAVIDAFSPRLGASTRRIFAYR
jgi:O-antigen/teichoic acid export membrane protein